MMVEEKISRSKLTFMIMCDACKATVYDKEIEVLSGAIVIMQEWLSDVNKSIEAHKMICGGSNDSKLRHKLR